jgi:hypothetical protein
MAGYTARQSVYTTGDTIEAADTNDEFDAILAAFNASTGHAHDGTTGNGPNIAVANVTGAATSGANSNITSLTGLTTALTVAQGGSGATTLTDGGILLGSGTGAVTALAAMADGEMVVGDGTTDPVLESGATLRTSIGVGTGDSPQFTGIEVGAASDTTLTRSGAGVLAVEGNVIYHASGTDVPVADGGTGASSAGDARTNLGLVIGTDVQAQGDVLDDLNTLGAASADGEFVVATGAGAFAYEAGATARTSLGLGTVATLDTGTTSGLVPLVGTKSSSVTLAGLVERSTSAENVTGTDDTVTPTVAGVKEMIDTHAAGGVNPNKIINGGFQVNQRNYVSTTATADGTYMHDRWRSGTANSSYTFSSASPNSPQTVTIAANDSIEQVIEGVQIDTAGTHTISWSGTATARGVVNTQTMSGNFAVSPITVTAVLDQVITLQFTGADAAGGSTIATDTGTLGKVKCELGSDATAFEGEIYSEVLAKCQRYCWRISDDGANHAEIGVGFADSATVASIEINFPVPMRTNAPTLDISATNDFSIDSSPGTTTSSAVAVTFLGSDKSNLVNFTGASGTHVAGQGLHVYMPQASGSYFGYEDEL